MELDSKRTPDCAVQLPEALSQFLAIQIFNGRVSFAEAITEKILNCNSRHPGWIFETSGLIYYWIQPVLIRYKWLWGQDMGHDIKRTAVHRRSAERSRNIRRLINFSSSVKLAHGNGTDQWLSYFNLDVISNTRNRINTKDQQTAVFPKT